MLSLYVSFCNLCLSLQTTFVRFVSVDLSMHVWFTMNKLQFTGIWVTSTFFFFYYPKSYRNAQILVPVLLYICVQTFSRTHLEGEWLGQTEHAPTTLVAIAKVMSPTLLLPTNQFSLPILTLFIKEYCQLLHFCQLKAVKCYLILFLICMSLITCGTEPLFCSFHCLLISSFPY